MKTSFIKMKKGDSEICLVGAVHFATQKYYDKLQQILDDGKTLFEGVSNINNIDSNLNKIYDLFKRSTKGSEFVFQKEGIIYRDNWDNSDLDISLQDNFLPEIDSILEIDEDLLNKIFLFLFRLIIFKIDLTKITYLIPFKGFKNFKIVKIRNYKVFIDSLNLSIRGHNMINVFYGEKHINHLKKMYKAFGYKVVSKSKIKVEK